MKLTEGIENETAIRCCDKKYKYNYDTKMNKNVHGKYDAPQREGLVLVFWPCMKLRIQAGRRFRGVYPFIKRFIICRRLFTKFGSMGSQKTPTAQAFKDARWLWVKGTTRKPVPNTPT